MHSARTRSGLFREQQASRAASGWICRYGRHELFDRGKSGEIRALGRAIEHQRNGIETARHRVVVDLALAHRSNQM
jgi:hypothetical protein